MALAGIRQLRSPGPVSVHAHRTEGVTGSKGREGANWVGGGNGDVNGDGNGDGAGTRTGGGANEGTKYGNRDGSGDGAGTGVEARGRTREVNGDGSGDGNESSSEDENGDGDRNGDGNEDGIGEGEGEENKRKRPHKSCRRDVGNWGDSGGKRKKRIQERVRSVAADPDNLENDKEAGGEAQGTRA